MTDRLLLLLLLLVVTKPAASACSDESSSLLCATKLVRRLTGSENPTYKVYDSNEVLWKYKKTHIVAFYFDVWVAEVARLINRYTRVFILKSQALLACFQEILVTTKS